VLGALQGVISNFPYFLGTLLTMAYELGRDVVLSRRARLELAEARAQLAQAERVSVLGQLASTLVHELTQPLAATSVNLEAALWQMKSKKPDLEQLHGILADVSGDNRRAVDIIDGMRQLFRRRSIAMQPLGLEDLVQSVVSLVRAEAASKHIAVSLRMQPGLPLVSADRVHLSQVLLNLLMNSIHAVQSRPLHARCIGVEARADDAKGEVEVTVLDSGPGIPDNCVDRVFKPFFTTKSDGMGIGLALSCTIIEAHGGRLWTDRASQHEGAVFRFTLRRAERTANVQTFLRDENKLIVANSGIGEMDLVRTGSGSAEAVDRVFQQNS
jgi:C4-dicarboxylate-specific signal transduction histidine kinase